jgi:formamidopyrimidine-DNA glycosylase
MPELPEVETVARTLKPVLTGKRIESFDLLWPRTLASPDLIQAQTHLVGHYVTHVGRRAKFVVISLDSADSLTVHLRMTGELLFYDTRKFGRMSLLIPAEFNALDRSLGVEPLGQAFTLSTMRDLLSTRRRQIKPLLLDQTVIAGLGNIYVDEALFRAGIHPMTQSSLVETDQADTLHDAIVTILSGAIERRGTTFRSYRSGLGEQGENQRTLLVYGQKSGSPCPRCGSALERMVVGQRGTVCCPRCQPLISSLGTQSR